MTSVVNSAGALLALASLRKGDVKIDGHTVLIREMTPADKARFSEVMSKDAMQGLAFLVARCTIDEAGNRLMTDEQAAELASGSGSVVQAIANAVIDLGQRAGKVSAPSSDSSTDSPSASAVS